MKTHDELLKEIQDLTEQKRAWYEIACQQGQPEKINRVARVLGKIVDNQYIKYLYEDDEIRIFLDTYGQYTTVALVKLDRVVASLGRTDKMYVPGKWEDHLEEVHRKALKIDNDKKTRALEKTKNALSHELCLDIKGEI